MYIQVEKARIETHEVNAEEQSAVVASGQSMQASLDIPESVGVEGPSAAVSSSMLVGLDSGKRWGKRRL